MNLLLLGYHFCVGAMLVCFTMMIVGSIINGLIFAVIFRLIAHLTLPQALVLVVVVIGFAYMWARSRDRARW